MQTLPSSYLLEIAKQMAFLSAFLGGFAATFLATLLVLKSEKPITTWTIAATALAACSLIVAVVGSVTLTVVLHPDVPASVAAGSSITKGRIVSSLGFGLGIVALLVSVGLSGWIRSQRAGMATSAIALVSLVAVVSAITQVG